MYPINIENYHFRFENTQNILESCKKILHIVIVFQINYDWVHGV